MSKQLETWTPKQFLEKLYLPLEHWLQQHGIDYPWSAHAAQAAQASQAAQTSLTATNPTNKATYKTTGKLSAKTSAQQTQAQQAEQAEPNQWKTPPDSYAVWVSEVMLQQTRTETVRPYYLKWLERWPTLADLARAEPDQVLKQWEGLGYYSRPLNMLSCAKKCCDELLLDGLPNSFAKLRALPGIGPYIAAAVASISGNEAVLAFDTNVKRIFCRLYQQQHSPALEKHWQSVHSRTLALCAWRGGANISLIQLGQQLCKAKSPLCFRCPLQEFCPVAASGNWSEFPAARVYQRQSCQSQRLLFCAEGKYLLLRKRSGHLRHLWRLPECEQLNCLMPNTENRQQAEYFGQYIGSFKHAYLQMQESIQVFCYNSETSQQQLNIWLQRQEAWQKTQRKTQENKKQKVTHTAEQGKSEITAKSLESEFPDWCWASWEELEQLTLAGPYRKFLQQALKLP